MIEEPRVTIGIPFFNEAPYLSSTIESAVQQTFKNIRIILADNCSTDSSAQLAEKYAGKDNRISVFRHSINHGPTHNFQFVLDKANSKYFAWLGGHDEFNDNYIENAVRALEENENAVIAYPGGITIDKNGELISAIQDDYDTSGLRPYRALYKILQNFHNGYVIHGVFRTEILRKIPFKKVIGSDMFIVSIATLYGDIIRLPIEGFRRRQVKTESFEEQKARHMTQGIYAQSVNPYANLFLALAREIVFTSRLSILEKIRVLKNTKRIFSYRFMIRWRDILLYKLINVRSRSI